MENAIIINRFKDISAVPDEFDRIYFGNEFCQWLLPTLTDLKKVRDCCRENGKALTLMTPWVTDAGLEKVSKLVSGCLEDDDALEVIANDLGVLKLLNDEFSDKIEIVAGRLLSNQRRDPRTLTLKSLNIQPLHDHYQHSSYSYQLFIDYLTKQFNVQRVELDSLPQGTLIPCDLTGVVFSLYYPYSYVTVNRNCPFCYNGERDSAVAEQATQKSKLVDPWNNKTGCAKKCIGNVMKLKSNEIEGLLYMKGTATFIKNDDLVCPESKQIDRLVFAADVPV